MHLDVSIRRTDHFLVFADLMLPFSQRSQATCSHSPNRVSPQRYLDADASMKFKQRLSEFVQPTTEVHPDDHAAAVHQHIANALHDSFSPAPISERHNATQHMVITRHS